MGTIRIHKTFETEKEARDWASNYLNSYNPCGYDTRLDVKQVDGKWVVTGSRLASCD